MSPAASKPTGVCAQRIDNLLAAFYLMNKTRLRQLTFGYEIEGVFDNSLRNLSGTFKHDGSVNTDMPGGSDFEELRIGDDEESETCERCDGEGYIYNDCECEHSRLDCRDSTHITPSSHDDDCYIRPCDEDSDYHRETCSNCDGEGYVGGGGEETAAEYASPVFQTLEEALKELSQFKSGNNHLHDKSCGLHFHIGLKNNHWKTLYNAVSDLTFLKKVRNEALGWCDCQHERLEFQDDLYYQFWKNPKDFVQMFQGKQQERNFNGDSLKYRFMRFHKDYKTLEFRFLEPCEHKCANIEKLVSLVTDHLAEKSEYAIEASSTINPPEKAIVDISLKTYMPKTIPNKTLSYTTMSEDMARSMSEWYMKGIN